MRAIILGVVLVVASVNALLEPRLGYHDSVGFPAAERIRAAEEAELAKNPKRVDPRIVGGAVAFANSHPYLAGLVISFWNIQGVSVCGSSLLSNNRLVTAAHCWNDGVRQASQFEVVMGSQFLFSGGTRIATSQVIMHAQWIPSQLLNDVAMIYLPVSVFFTQAIQPVSLPSGSQLWDTFAGQWAVAAGYGKTSDSQTGVTTATQISQVTLQVITVQACQAVFGSWAQASNICTNGAGGVGICGGDSGGPLVINSGGQNILVGISSFVAAAGCQLGFPSAFARVTSFQTFIQQHMW